MPDSLTDLAGLDVSAEDFLAAVLKTTAQPVWVVDPEGVIRFANPAAIEALGYDDASELFGRSSHDTIHPRYPDGSPYPAAECPMLLPHASGETVASDLDWFFRRDGSMFPVSYVSVPIEMPQGRGAVVAFTDIETRQRTEQMLRDHDAVLAAQLSSLRRVATLVAGGAASREVFAAIAREVGEVIGLPLVAVWRYDPNGMATVIGAWGSHPHPFQAGTRWPLDGPTVLARVLETGRFARIDDFADVPGTIAEAARDTGIHSRAGAPIVVDGHVWGAMSTDSLDQAPLPEQIEERLTEFTELVATAISNTASREQLARLADEQAALRRVATLVAQSGPPNELFEAVTAEVGLLLGTDLAGMIRYLPDDALTPVATWAAEGEHPEVGGTWSLEGDRLATTILKTGRPAREDKWGDVSGAIAEFVRDVLGIESSVGSPIIVEGSVWGALFVHTKQTPRLPADTESRLTNFTELVATAISNAHARIEVRRLADEQAALRRVATLVAQESPPAQVFAAVAEEVARLLGVEDTTIFRYEDDWTATVVADRGERDVPSPIGSRFSLEGRSATALVRRTGRAARVDDFSGATGPLAEYTRNAGIGSTVGSAIVVDGRLWGAMIAATRTDEPMAADTESRIEEFTELVATAISNMQTRSDLAASRARIVAATDAERRRVVRDLHDGAQQRLVHTVVTLKLAQQALQPDDASASELVAEARAHAESATAELRELAHGILPAVLTHGGLRSGLEALASRMPVPLDLDAPVERLPAPIEATAYFVVAEALTNVAKHARAGSAAVTARLEGGTLRVEVRDDGVGGASPEGHGLLGLRDRLAALDGRLRVESPAGAGTLVAADIPLAGAPGSAQRKGVVN